jgi:hypothetical protein
MQIVHSQLYGNLQFVRKEIDANARVANLVQELIAAVIATGSTCFTAVLRQRRSNQTRRRLVVADIVIEILCCCYQHREGQNWTTKTWMLW